MNHRLSSYQYKVIFPLTNPDITFEILKFASIKDLGSLCSVCCSAWEHTQSNVLWKHFDLCPHVFKQYPIGTPLKRIVAASLYVQYIHWNEHSDSTLTRYRRRKTIATKQFHYAVENIKSFKRQKGCFKARMKKSFHQLWNTPLFNAQWEHKGYTFDDSRRACEQLRYVYLREKEKKRRKRMRVKRSTFRIKRFENRLRMHNIFIKYLRFYWYYLR